MGAIAYLSALVRSKNPVGRDVAFTLGYGKNPVNWSRIGSKFGWYGKVNQESGRFANVLFHFRVHRKGRSISGPLSGPVGFLQVHASAFHLLNWLVSPSILEELSFTVSVFLIFRNELLNFNFSEPQNSFFFQFYYWCFFSFFNHKLSPFRRWSMNVFNCLEIVCMHFCVFGRSKKLQILFLGCLKKS